LQESAGKCRKYKKSLYDNSNEVANLLKKAGVKGTTKVGVVKFGK
jgi:hypothetical protein